MPIEKLEATMDKRQLRDPVVLYNMIRKINEIIDAIDGRKNFRNEPAASKSVGVATKK